MFNSRVAIAVKNRIGNSEGEEQSKVITPSKRVKPTRSKRNEIGNPNISLAKNHPATVIESRRKYAAREYLDKVTEAGSPVSPLAASALGLSQSGDGIWNTNGTPDERLYGQNLTKYIDTKLVPNDTEDASPVSQTKKRFRRLLNKGYAGRDNVTFGTLIRDPYFKIDTSKDIDGSSRIPIGRDESTGKVVNPLAKLTSHHFGGQEDFLSTVDGIEKGAFPTKEGTPPSITNINGAINRGLRDHAKRFNKSLFVDPSGNKTSFFQGFTTLAKNIQSMTKPYDRTKLQPPTPEELSKGKDLVRTQRPDLFNPNGDYANSDVAGQVNDAISRHVIDRNNKTQLQQHQNEHSGLVRALNNVAVCPCAHCQISNYENPLATVLDASLHREVKTSDDPILKNVFKKHFGFYNPHALMVNDPETIYTREDGTKGGGHPHSLSTNIVRQVLHKRLKLRGQDASSDE